MFIGHKLNTKLIARFRCFENVFPCDSNQLTVCKIYECQMHWTTFTFLFEAVDFISFIDNKKIKSDFFIERIVLETLDISVDGSSSIDK